MNGMLDEAGIASSFVVGGAGASREVFWFWRRLCSRLFSLFAGFGDCVCAGTQRIQSSQLPAGAKLSDDEVGFTDISSPEDTSHDGRVSSLKGNSLDIRSSITAFLNLGGLGELSKQLVGVVEDGLKSSKMQYGPTCFCQSAPCLLLGLLTITYCDAFERERIFACSGVSHAGYRYSRLVVAMPNGVIAAATTMTMT